MTASPGMTIRGADVGSRAPAVAPSANPQVMVTATVSPRARPQPGTTALTADRRVPPDQPEETLVRAALVAQMVASQAATCPGHLSLIGSEDDTQVNAQVRKT